MSTNTVTSVAPKVSQLRHLRLLSLGRKKKPYQLPLWARALCVLIALILLPVGLLGAFIVIPCLNTVTDWTWKWKCLLEATS